MTEQDIRQLVDDFGLSVATWRNSRKGPDREAAHREFIAAKHALLSAYGAGAVPSGWLPMETAPKDGEFVLLLTPLKFPKHGHQELPFTGRWFNGMWVIVNADMAIQRVEPKGWMPLPPSGVKGLDDARG